MQAADFPVLAGLPRVSRCARRSPEQGLRAHAAVKRRFERAASRYFALRRQLELPAYPGTLFEGPPSAAGRIALFSRHLLWAPPNLPTEIAGFPPAGGLGSLPPAVREFLARDAAPVLVSLGSVLSLSAAALMNQCIAAARRLGRRTIILSMAARRTPRAESDMLLVSECSPRALLPRCAALVTHAGIGTVGDALATGTPMLCLPHYGDQFDNADRVARAGVGLIAMPQERDGEMLAEALRDVIETPAYRRNAAVWPQLLAAENAAQRAMATIEHSVANA
jgi:UDP:flavonoid glycosyltransferase YjiC (YdhE family)